MIIRQIYNCLILKVAQAFDVLGAVPLQLWVQPEVSCTGLYHALQLRLAVGGEVGVIAVQLKALLGTGIAWWHIAAKLQTGTIM